MPSRKGEPKKGRFTPRGILISHKPAPTSAAPAVGWKLIAWSSRYVACNVDACGKLIRSGFIRVDRPEPWKGDPVICPDCYFKIMVAGIDPDPAATIPSWEENRRAETDPDS